MREDIEKVFFSREQIAETVERLGRQITEDYRGKNPLLVGVLKGSFVFMADLIKNIDTYCNIDFMAVSSYGSGTKSSGVVRIVKDLDTNIEGRHVLIVEDILDSGLTLSHLKGLLEHRNAASVRIAAFTIKDIEGHTPAVTPDYAGTHVPNEFIVGYGLDYAERYRNLPYIGILKPEVYS